MVAKRMMLAFAVLGSVCSGIDSIGGQRHVCALDKIDQDLVLSDRNDSWSNLGVNGREPKLFLGDLSDLWKEEGSANPTRGRGAMQPQLTGETGSTAPTAAVGPPSEADAVVKTRKSRATRIVERTLPWMSGVFGAIGLVMVICGLLTQRQPPYAEAEGSTPSARSVRMPNHSMRQKEHQRRRAA